MKCAWDETEKDVTVQQSIHITPFSNSELGCCKNSSKCEESMKLGMMVDIDHTKKFSLVSKMKYA